MNFENNGAPTRNILIKALTDELARGVEIISALDDFTYPKIANGTGSIGGQFRHNLDFVQCLLNGIRNGKIDYSQRERDLRVEENRHCAKERFTLLIKEMNDLSPELFERRMHVRSEIDDAVWNESTAGRELEFVLSHTVHHHALIAEKMNSFGMKTPSHLGVAASTLRFWGK